ncbi:MAG: hypothetical protein IPL61_35185 [Myxococcales bacterium]|nr:hypothetical protein [Myxococcales bacterium]
MHRTRTTSPGLVRAVKGAAVAACAAALGCGFQASGPGGDGDGGRVDAAVTDGPVASDGRPPLDAVDAADPPGGFCAEDPALIVCMTFDSGAATNEVFTGPQITTSTGLTPSVGRVGMAGGFATDTVVWWNETSALDVQAPFTIEMFIYYTVDPPLNGASADRRIGLIDNNGQYSMFLGWHQAAGAPSESVTPYCNINATAWGAPVSRNTWHHVACVHTGATLTVYTDGVAGVPTNTATPITTTGGDGTTLGQNCDSDPTTTSTPLVGGLDELRLWTVARSPVELLAAAQR